MPVVLTTALAIIGGGAAIIAMTLGGDRSATGTPSPGPARTAGSSTSDQAGSGVPLIAPRVTAPTSLADGRTLGRSNAPVTMVVWSDFQCPSCAAFTREVQPKITDDFVSPGTLRVTYRDYAFIGQESIDAAVAARCAADQGRFWPYHDYLFWNQKGENSGAFDGVFFDSVARVVGLDMTAFDRCLGSPTGPAGVSADSAAAEAAGVTVTPTLQIGETMMPGAPLSDAQYDVLRKVIERTVAGQ